MDLVAEKLREAKQVIYGKITTPKKVYRLWIRTRKTRKKRWKMMENTVVLGLKKGYSEKEKKSLLQVFFSENVKNGIINGCFRNFFCTKDVDCHWLFFKGHLRSPIWGGPQEASTNMEN